MKEWGQRLCTQSSTRIVWAVGFLWTFGSKEAQGAAQHRQTKVKARKVTEGEHSASLEQISMGLRTWLCRERCDRGFAE